MKNDPAYKKSWEESQMKQKRLQQQMQMSQMGYMGGMGGMGGMMRMNDYGYQNYMGGYMQGPNNNGYQQMQQQEQPLIDENEETVPNFQRKLKREYRNIIRDEERIK